jgi:hypothetical protein
MGKSGKEAIITEYLPWLIIAVAVLAILTISIFALKGQGLSLIGKLKGLLRA